MRKTPRPTYSLDGGKAFYLREFIKDNPDIEPRVLARIRRLKVGESMTLGGGAGAEFILMRVNRDWDWNVVP
jgi:hypothetical protein